MPVPEVVQRAADDIRTLEFCAGEWNGDAARLVDVSKMDAAAFRALLVGTAGAAVHVWMPGEHHWLIVSRAQTNRVSLADAMEAFASDPERGDLAGVFASYVGTREEILPAFAANLQGNVLPQWFVTRDIPTIAWLDAEGVEPDILTNVAREVRSAQIVRREILEGNIAAAQAADKQGERAATDLWAKAYLRNPNDSMLLERIDNLNRNAKGFLAVNKVLQAMKCYETIVLINPNDATAIHNFGACLKRIGKLDMAEKVLKRAETLRKAMEETK